MFPFSDQAGASPALHAGFDAQATYLATLAQRSVELLARVSELNLQLARQALESTLETGRQMAACTDPLQLGSIAMHGLQPAGEHVRHYQEGLLGLLTETGSAASPKRRN